MVAFHQDGEHQSGVIGPRGLPKSVVGPFMGIELARAAQLGEMGPPPDGIN
jgi:hypothetical protein